jgi:hypothetical protein
MPFSGISRVPASNCERLAITLGNKSRPDPIWLSTAAIGQSEREGIDDFFDFFSLLAAPSKLP